MRGDVSAPPHRAPVAGDLLAVPLSKRHGPVAAVPQPADLGRLRRLDLRNGFGAVLVHWPRSGHGDAARSREVACGAEDLRHAGARVAWISQALAAVRDGVSAARRNLDA